MLIKELLIPITVHEDSNGTIITALFFGEEEIGARVICNKHELLGVDVGEKEIKYEGFVHKSFVGEYEFKDTIFPNMKVVVFDSLDELLEFHNRIYLN